MNRRTLCFHHCSSLFTLLILILSLVLIIIFAGVIGTAFADIGFSPLTTSTILFASFFGSLVNIPLFEIESINPISRERFVSVFGFTYRIPQIAYAEQKTIVAVNVGGAIIPIVVSLYLLWKQPSAILFAISGVIMVAIATYFVARPVKGVGIVTPVFLSPLIAALSAHLLHYNPPYIIAYVAGSLGTLIGADLLKFNVLPKLGAPVASIGGAGTFDGVFLSGITAVLLEIII